MKRKFLVVYLNFPQLKNVNYAIHNEKVEETAANDNTFDCRFFV